MAHGLLYRGGAHALQEVWLDKMDMVEMLAPEVLDRASPTMRRLLGWENYLSLGMLDGLPS